MFATQRHPVPDPPELTPQPEDSFRPDIEGLRAVAVLLVVVGHVFGVPRGGYVGVDVFFVVSGFLITGLLLREHGRTGRISLRDFYARRARRLLPAAVLVLAVTNIAAFLLFTADRAGQALRDSLWSLGFLANVRFSAVGTDYFDETRPASPVQHYWSLAVEEQFYVVWPLLLLLSLWLVRRTGAGVVLVLITTASLAWSLHLTSSNATVAYFSSPGRAWELGVGALLALGAQAGYIQRLPQQVAIALGWLGLLGVVGSAFLLTDLTPFPGVAALVPVMSTALVLQAGEAGAADRNPVLVNPVSRYVGRISYSLYLWHWPVLILALAVLPSWSTIVVTLALSFGLAALSHRYVEEPVRRSSWLARRPPVAAVPVHAVPRRGIPLQAEVVPPAPLLRRDWRPGVATGAAAALLVGGFVLPALALQQGPEPEVRPSQGAQASGPVLAEQIAASVAPEAWPPLDPPLDGISFAGSPEWLVDKCDNVNPGNIDKCSYGPPTARRTAALFGDSMAISWLPALREVLEPLGFRIQVLTRNQCPAPAVMFFRDRPEVPFTQCAEHKAWALEQVRALRPELVVVSSSLTYLDHQVGEPQGQARFDRWRDGTTLTLTALEEVAGEVVVLGAPPRAGNVQECVTRLSDPADCTEDVPDDWRGVRAAEQAAAKTAGAQYVDPEQWFCADGRCPAVVGSTPVYTDGRHLTAAYARRLVPQLAEALDVTQPA